MKNSENGQDFIATALQDAELMINDFIAYLQATDPDVGKNLKTLSKNNKKQKKGRK